MKKLLVVVVVVLLLLLLLLKIIIGTRKKKAIYTDGQAFNFGRAFPELDQSVVNFLMNTLFILVVCVCVCNMYLTTN